MKRALIFRNELLPRSETFIHAQSSALRHFSPCFAGVHPSLQSLALLSEPAFAASGHSFACKLKRRLYWRTGYAPTLYRQLRELNPALVHAHFAIDGAAALPIAQALAIPLIVTLHGYDVSASDVWLRRSPEGRVFLRRREQLFDQASVFLCISKFIQQKALERGFPSGKLRLHYTGSDLSLFQPVSLERDPNMVLFTGRLVEKKGCMQLLDALALVRLHHPAVHLAIIGSGPLESALRQQAKDKHLPCKFLGTQPPEVVRLQMARAAIFCVPSTTASNGDSEGLGMVFAEAQAMGTPVVSTIHGGIPEVVRHGLTGLLSAEGDVAGLAANLLRLLQDRSLRQRLSQNGPAFVARHFDISTQTAELEDIYTQVLDIAAVRQRVPLSSACLHAGTTMR